MQERSEVEEWPLLVGLGNVETATPIHSVTCLRRRPTPSDAPVVENSETVRCLKQLEKKIDALEKRLRVLVDKVEKN